MVNKHRKGGEHMFNYITNHNKSKYIKLISTN